MLEQLGTEDQDGTANLADIEPERAWIEFEHLALAGKAGRMGLRHVGKLEVGPERGHEVERKAAAGHSAVYQVVGALVEFGVACAGPDRVEQDIDSLEGDLAGDDFAEDSSLAAAVVHSQLWNGSVYDYMNSDETYHVVDVVAAAHMPV